MFAARRATSRSVTALAATGGLPRCLAGSWQLASARSAGTASSVPIAKADGQDLKDGSVYENYHEAAQVRAPPPPLLIPRGTAGKRPALWRALSMEQLFPFSTQNADSADPPPATGLRWDPARRRLGGHPGRVGAGPGAATPSLDTDQCCHPTRITNIPFVREMHRAL